MDGRNNLFDADLLKAAALSVKQQLQQVGREVNKSPSEAQQDAGNYRKGHIRLHGLNISIENPRGSTRSGTAKDGKQWSITMAHNYGYIRGTVGRDKDHLDVFIGPEPECELVFVVNQNDPATGKFDEHKCMLGFDNEADARAGYLSNYEDGWGGLGEITAMTMPQFKWWIGFGDMNKPIEGGFFARHRRKAAEATWCARCHELWEDCHCPGKEEAEKAASDVKKTKVQVRVHEEVVEICPHCDEEFREKSYFHDTKTGLDYHRGCDDPVDHSDYQAEVEKRKTPEDRESEAQARAYWGFDKESGVHQHETIIYDCCGSIHRCRCMADKPTRHDPGPCYDCREKQANFTNRAIAAQLNSPSWDQNSPFLQNLWNNVQQAQQRGQQMVQDQDSLQDVRSHFEPGFGMQRMQAALAGQDQVVSDPIDQLLFRPQLS